MRTVQQLIDLRDKTALVTGGSRGLGLQIAEALGEQAARIVLSARKPDERRCRRAASALARRRCAVDRGGWRAGGRHRPPCR